MNKLAWLMAISATIATLNGIMLIAVPEIALASHGVNEASGAILPLARMLGATLIGFAIINFIARKSPPSLALWALVLGDACADTLSFGISLAEQLQGTVVGAEGWLTVALYLAFASGFWFFFFTVRLK